MTDQAMNIKAQSFADYLEANKVKAFAVTQLQDEINTTLFRSNITVKGQNLKTLLILDDSIYGILRVIVAPKMVSEKNKAVVLPLLNSYNIKYKAFKYYVEDTGTIVLDASILLENKAVNVDMINAVIQVVVKHLLEAYPHIMSLVWSEEVKENEPEPYVESLNKYLSAAIKYCRDTAKRFSETHKF